MRWTSLFGIVDTTKLQQLFGGGCDLDARQQAYLADPRDKTPSPTGMEQQALPEEDYRTAKEEEMGVLEAPPATPAEWRKHIGAQQRQTRGCNGTKSSLACEHYCDADAF